MLALCGNFRGNGHGIWVFSSLWFTSPSVVHYSARHANALRILSSWNEQSFFQTINTFLNIRLKERFSLDLVVIFTSRPLDQYARYWTRSAIHAWLKRQWSLKYDVSLNCSSTRSLIGCVNLLFPIGQVLWFNPFKLRNDKQSGFLFGRSNVFDFQRNIFLIRSVKI